MPFPRGPMPAATAAFEVGSSAPSALPSVPRWWRPARWWAEAATASTEHSATLLALERSIERSKAERAAATLRALSWFAMLRRVSKSFDLQVGGGLPNSSDPLRETALCSPSHDRSAAT